MIFLTVYLFLQTFFNVQCANILGYFPSVSVSHHMTFRPVYKELSLRGHNVTVMTALPLNDPSLTNLTEIDLGFKIDPALKIVQGLSASLYNRVHFVLHICNFALDKQLKQIQQIALGGTKFDIVLVQPLCPIFYGAAAQHEAPIVGSYILSLVNN